MNKILIALGLTLATATGAFAQPNFNYDRLPGATYNQTANAEGGIDYTATASFDRDVQSTQALDEMNRERNIRH